MRVESEKKHTHKHNANNMMFLYSDSFVWIYVGGTLQVHGTLNENIHLLSHDLFSVVNNSGEEIWLKVCYYQRFPMEISSSSVTFIFLGASSIFRYKLQRSFLMLYNILHDFSKSNHQINIEIFIRWWKTVQYLMKFDGKNLLRHCATSFYVILTNFLTHLFTFEPATHHSSIVFKRTHKVSNICVQSNAFNFSLYNFICLTWIKDWKWKWECF